MYLRLAKANFTVNLGTMASLSKSWSVSYTTTSNITRTNCPSFVSYNESTLKGTLTATVTLTAGATFNSVTVTSGTAGTPTTSINGQVVTITVPNVASNIALNIVATGGSSAGGSNTPGNPTNYTFTINPTPASATVTLFATGYSTVSGTGSKSITVANSTKVNWRVEASGYATRTGSWTISGGNKTENITLSASGGSNYIDITVQGTEKGSIKDSVIKIPDSTSLYLITKVQLPSNATSVEYQAFKTGGSYGSAFVNDAGTVVKFLPKTNVTIGDRVTETVPSGATWFYHMYDDPNNTEQEAPAFTYIRVYTSGESGGGGSAEGLPVRITKQNENNHGLLDATTGVFEAKSFGDGGGQTVTVCSIPTGATTVNYQMFKTSNVYGSCFKNAGGAFISGHVNKTEDAGTRKTLSIPSGATEFWHMYPDSTYAQGDGKCPVFDYIEFA